MDFTVQLGNLFKNDLDIVRKQFEEIQIWSEEYITEIDLLKDEFELLKNPNKGRGRARKPLRETQSRTTNSVVVKKEKITDVMPQSKQKESVTSPQQKESMENVQPPKQRESVENMPPPQLVPVVKTEKKAGGTRRTKTKKQKQKDEEEVIVKEEKNRKDSDVILQQENIPLVDLCLDEDREVRSTRTRTVRKAEPPTEAIKRSRSPSEDSATSKETKSARTKRKKAARKESSVYEDALADEEPLKDKKSPDATKSDKEIPKETVNITYVQQPLNATYVQEPLNATYIQPNANNKDMKDILTDDDSPIHPPPPPLTKHKQLFSPFERSPVKKKVEAFEKLGAAATTPVRQTRTKTRAQAKQNIEAEQVTKQPPPTAKPKEKSKYCTPLAANRFFPASAAASTSKLTTSAKSSLIEAPGVPKAMSAAKASAAEYREREMRRQKEAEAKQKREALLQAQIEEKRKKREEKQMKAQQARKAMEEDKQKEREAAERAKEEKFRQMQAEREAKIQKQKEQMLKKKDRMPEAKKDMIPVYMVTKAPLLPTPDCYDSDSEEAEKVRIVLPKWTTGEELGLKQKCMYWCGERLKNTFFWRKAVTVDLAAIFQTIDPKKLRRTSSAHWDKPPRYALMPEFNNTLEATIEANEDSSDED